MITITEDLCVRQLVPASSPETSFKCPFCGVMQVVFIVLPYCCHCRKQLLDAKRLMENENYALKYHFNEIDDHGALNIIHDHEV